MKSFAEQIATLSKAGYRIAEAQSKVAHDAVLLAYNDDLPFLRGLRRCWAWRARRSYANWHFRPKG